MKQFKVSGPQIVISFFGISIILLFLYSAAFGHPSLFDFLFLAFITYWLACFFFVTAEPIDEKVLQTTKTIDSLAKSTCPFCQEEPISAATLKVGYKRGRYSDFKYMIILISWNHAYQEISSRIPIGESCKARYLKASSRFMFLPRGMRNPSKTVLKRKWGFRRGLVFPFEPSNLKSSPDE